MKQSPLHLIHVEDSWEDSELVQRMLKTGGLECVIHRVETREQLETALRQPNCDLILSDCTLPQFHGLEALEIVRNTKPEIPFIFVSGTIGEEVAIKSLQNGATDYVLKNRPARLIPAVRRAMSEKKNRLERRTMECNCSRARKLEAVGSLVGELAHDFRNLLQILKTSIELLPLMVNDSQQILQIAEQLDKATDRGCSMVNELLLFARKTEVHLVPIDVAAQIKETAQLIRPLLSPTVNLSLQLEESLPPVLADAGHLDRMLTNLVLNARDALPAAGGNIVVSLDVIRFDPLSSDSWQIRDVPYLRIRVSDDGTGMDEITQSRIFEPFFTTKPAGKGTGLGLSVVFGLMEAHHGFIDLHSEVDEGTTFSLFFPLPPETQVSADKIQALSPIRLLGKTTHPEAMAA